MCIKTDYASQTSEQRWEERERRQKKKPTAADRDSAVMHHQWTLVLEQSVLIWRPLSIYLRTRGSDSTQGVKEASIAKTNMHMCTTIGNEHKSKAKSHLSTPVRSTTGRCELYDDTVYWKLVTSQNSKTYWSVNIKKGYLKGPAISKCTKQRSSTSPWTLEVLHQNPLVSSTHNMSGRCVFNFFFQLS